MVQLTQFIAAASASVGLLCYALSSSFNNLFGNWDPSKIFTYCMSGSAICLAILFPQALQNYLRAFLNRAHMMSRNRFIILFIKMWQFLLIIFQNQAHSRLLVLTLTTLYSYYSNKAANGKPDANSPVSSLDEQNAEVANGKQDVYGPVSSAAFATMSFCLSRHWAFDDLMYFFLGLLIIQLMQIKKLLGFVGLVFTSFLIIIPPYLQALVQYGRN